MMDSPQWWQEVVYDRVVRGDFTPLQELATPDFELLPAKDVDGHTRGFLKDRYEGINGAEAAVADWTGDVWGTFEFQVRDVVAVGADRILVYLRQTGIGEASGAEVHEEVAHLYTSRGDKLARLETFNDLDAARRAAGLRRGQGR